jgi:CDP-6-deoxy-D-xylo-4-hexulose-3-dehydrase
MKKINLVSDTIDRDDINDLISWLSQDETPRLTKGPLTIEFETMWSRWLGVRRSVFVNSGSSAILLALASMREAGMLKNDKVVVPTLSWLTDVSSPIQLGMEPILCDCNLYDLSVDIDQLEVLFKKYNPGCFILVSVLGLVPDMDKIVDLCKRYDVRLLEDVCESMGSQYDNTKLGTYGDVSVFSLYYGHHLSTIEGGLVSTNNNDLADILIAMRSHGWDRDGDSDKQLEYRNKYNISEFDSLYTFYYPGYNLRSTDLQAKIGLNQIGKLEKFVSIRQKNFHLYNDRLKDFNRLNLSVRDTDTISNFAYPFVASNSEQRSKIVTDLRQANIEVRPLIAGSMASKPFWIKYSGKQELFINGSLINDCGFYVPNHQNLIESEIEMITNIILSAKK